MYWLTGLCGLAFIVAPFFLGYANNIPALWTSIVVGLIVAFVSVFRALDRQEARWEYIVAGVMGLLAVFAPFMLGFSAAATAMWTSIIIGAVLAILAGYQGFFARPQT
jgi:O-antigen/teichoic acid export membrane protein